jgi:HK97 family phage portal protein
MSNIFKFFSKSNSIQVDSTKNSGSNILEKSTSSSPLPPGYWVGTGGNVSPETLNPLGWLNATDPYTKLLVVNFAVRTIAANVNRLIKVTRLENESGEVIENDKTGNLFLKTPNGYETSTEMFLRIVSDLLLWGDAYAFIVGSKERPITVESLMSQYILPESESKFLPIPPVEFYWDVMKTNSSRFLKIPPSLIIHIKTYNPNSKIRGQSVLSSMLSELTLSGSIDEYQVKSFSNGFYPNIILNAPEFLEEQQREDIRTGLINQVRGPGGQKFLLLENKITAESMSFSPSDMKVIEHKNYTAAMIATAFGLPPELMGAVLDSKTFTNLEISTRQFMLHTVIPLYELIIGKINSEIFASRGLTLTFDENQVHELAIKTEDLSKQWWLTPNELRIRSGLKIKEEEKYDELYIPNAMSRRTDEISGEPEGQEDFSIREQDMNDD